MTKWNESYIGTKFGHLTVLGKSNKKGINREIKVICRCQCGKIIEPPFCLLRTGKQKSCRCKYRHKQQGYSKTKLYNIWYNIIQRCTDPKNKNYKHYGGRGITVCPEWNDFLTFRFQMRKKLIDAKKKYKNEFLTIERINNNKGYYYKNCTFIPLRLQAKNRRSVYPIKAVNRITGEEVYGENQTDLAKKINLTQAMVSIVILKKYRSRKWIMRPLLTFNKRKE